MIAAMARHGHDPIAKFIRWLEDARRARIPNYEAMALATVARSGRSSVRFVLLKGIDQRGFMFFTHARSRKGRELRGNPHGSPRTLLATEGPAGPRRRTRRGNYACGGRRVLAHPPATEPACRYRVASERSTSLACGTSRAVCAARSEVSGPRNSAAAALDRVSRAS